MHLNRAIQRQTHNKTTNIHAMWPGDVDCSSRNGASPLSVTVTMSITIQLPLSIGVSVSATVIVPLLMLIIVSSVVAVTTFIPLLSTTIMLIKCLMTVLLCLLLDTCTI